MNFCQIFRNDSNNLTDHSKITISNIFKSHLISKYFGPPWPEPCYSSFGRNNLKDVGIPNPDDPYPWPWPLGPLVREMFFRALIQEEDLGMNRDIFFSIKKEGFLLEEIESMQKSTLELQKSLENLKEKLS